MTDWDISKLQTTEISHRVIWGAAQNATSADHLRHSLRNQHGMELTKPEADAIYSALEAKRKEE